MKNKKLKKMNGKNRIHLKRLKLPLRKDKKFKLMNNLSIRIKDTLN